MKIFFEIKDLTVQSFDVGIYPNRVSKGAPPTCNSEALLLQPIRCHVQCWALLLAVLYYKVNVKG
jgi:hypothetical protein